MNSKPPKLIDSLVHTIRGQQVLLDADLAELYGVTTKVLNQAVKRKADRFPDDFRFQLTAEEAAASRSQIVTLNDPVANQSKMDADPLRSQIATSNSRGGRRYLPHAFTEHGAIMAATVLNSPQAVAMSVYVVRAFVQMRENLAANSAILKRLAEIDKSLLLHDSALRDVYQKLLPLLSPPPAPAKRRIGFHP